MYSNYTMHDFLRSVPVMRAGGKVVEPSAAIPVMAQQLMMVKAIKRRFESSLFDIRALVQADLFDNELDEAEELNKKGYPRGAGAIAGVVLEGHLTTVCKNLKISTQRNPTISRVNDLLT